MYDPRKIIGITTLAGSRANTYISKRTNVSADNVVCPIVGGFSPHSIVPVLSQTSPCEVPHVYAQKNKRYIKILKKFVSVRQ